MWPMNTCHEHNPKLVIVLKPIREPWNSSFGEFGILKDPSNSNRNFFFRRPSGCISKGHSKATPFLAVLWLRPPSMAWSAWHGFRKS